MEYFNCCLLTCTTQGTGRLECFPLVRPQVPVKGIHLSCYPISRAFRNQSSMPMAWRYVELIDVPPVDGIGSPIGTLRSLFPRESVDRTCVAGSLCTKRRRVVSMKPPPGSVG